MPANPPCLCVRPNLWYGVRLGEEDDLLKEVASSAKEFSGKGAGKEQFHHHNNASLYGSDADILEFCPDFRCID